MHYFKCLGLAIDPSNITGYHIGRESTTKDWLGNLRSDGKLKVQLFHKDGKVSLVTTVDLDTNRLSELYKETEKELSDYFCDKPKEAKEDPVENIFIQAEKDLKEKGILPNTPV